MDDVDDDDVVDVGPCYVMMMIVMPLMIVMLTML